MKISAVVTVTYKVIVDASDPMDAVVPAIRAAKEVPMGLATSVTVNQFKEVS